MKVLVLGGGGREHALCWKLRQSPLVTHIYAIPGNPGCAQVATCLSTPSLVDFARRESIGLTVAGPEAPLVEGVGDAFAEAGLRFFGPTARAAQLEGSKIFTKLFLQRHGIPTARFAVADSETEALAALRSFEQQVVVKADGLAAGKGVVVAGDHGEARAAIHAMFSGSLVGAAGRRVVLEECLHGEEISFIALTDGEEIVPLEVSQDHKRIRDNDEGPNTGGMGAYSDSRLMSAEQRRYVVEKILRPTVDGMREEGAPFRGFLYAGLMMTDAGPQVLEYNVRLGDPETQCLLHRMTGDLAALLVDACDGRLAGRTADFSPKPSVCVVMASHGYPGTVRTGDLITGIDAAERTGATVFHAGTRQSERGLETSGGRVLGVTAAGEDLKAAIAAAYRAVDAIHFDGQQVRRDIGAKGLSRYN